jgi:YD repeat-containing protein
MAELRTTSEYDALGYLKKTTTAIAANTENPAQTIVQLYQYDLVGNLRSQTDGLGRVTNYDYDALNRKAEQRDPLPLTSKQVWTYDTRGNVLTAKDRNGVLMVCIPPRKPH